MTTRQLFALSLSLIAALSLGASPALARGGGGDDAGNLVLRVSDAVGQPGGVVAVVVRTYAPRPIRQGQVSFRTKRGPARVAIQGDLAADQPFATLVGGFVFGPRGEVTYRASFGADAAVTFASPAALINAQDGPLAVLYLKLADDLRPGDTFTLDLDPANTFLSDAAGQPITVVPKPGLLRIKATGKSIELRAVGGRVDPGKKAALGVSTLVARPFSRGQVALRWNPAIQAAKPSVRMDARFGTATFTVDRSTPGLLIVAFTSPDSSLNAVPGKLIEVTLPTRATTRHGTNATIRIDPNLTYLATGTDDLTPFTMRAGVLAFN